VRGTPCPHRGVRVGGVDRFEQEFKAGPVPLGERGVRVWAQCVRGARLWAGVLDQVGGPSVIAADMGH